MRLTLQGAENLCEVKFFGNIYNYIFTSQYARRRKGMA